LKKERNAAITAAKKAGKIAMEKFEKLQDIRTKSSIYDYVTEADLLAEKEILNILRKKFPEHSILAEESGSYKGSNEFTWLVDPLDGTNNYSVGLPFFCVSIALSLEKEPVLGVVFDPLRNDLFVAEKGKGATRNGKKISVSGRSKLHEFVCVLPLRSGLKKQESWRIKQERFARVYRTVRSVRMFGASELELAYIASGKFDAFINYNINPWDAAAGAVLVREAGGKATNGRGKEWRIGEKVFIASNGNAHNELEKVLSL